MYSSRSLVMKVAAPCTYVAFTQLKQTTLSESDKVKSIGQLSAGVLAIGMLIGYQRFRRSEAPIKISQHNLYGVISFIDDGATQIIVSNNKSTNIVQELCVQCSVRDGVRLLEKKGPDIGRHLFNLACRKKIANATRTDSINGLGGKFVLSGNISQLLGTSDFVNRNTAVQRIEGECSVLRQWLHLHHQGLGGDCVELTQSKVSEKQQLLASGIVLIALLEITFAEAAWFKATPCSC